MDISLFTLEELLDILYLHLRNEGCEEWQADAIIGHTVRQKGFLQAIRSNETYAQWYQEVYMPSRAR